MRCGNVVGVFTELQRQEDHNGGKKLNSDKSVLNGIVETNFVVEKVLWNLE